MVAILETILPQILRIVKSVNIGGQTRRMGGMMDLPNGKEEEC